MHKNFIWDLDGTLLDSYPVIVASILSMLHDNQITMKQEDVYDTIIRTSVRDLISTLSKDYHISEEILRESMNQYSRNQDHQIFCIRDAEYVLSTLANDGHTHFVYTHNNEGALKLLEDNGIINYFEDIVTSAHHFKRKPDPEALNYLIDKHNLRKEDTYYVGDRRLDVACGINAKIQTIYFNPHSISIDLPTIEVYNLADILNKIKLQD